MIEPEEVRLLLEQALDQYAHELRVRSPGKTAAAHFLLPHLYDWKRTGFPIVMLDELQAASAAGDLTPFLAGIIPSAGGRKTSLYAFTVGHLGAHSHSGGHLRRDMLH